jgi:PAS domain-containing protein
MESLDIPQSKSAMEWRHWTIRYTAPLVATGVALCIWFLWPVMQKDPFAIFIAAVIVSARFFGFGPALLCTAASGLAIDYFALEPRFSFSISANDYGRLFVFIAVAVLTAGLARQRSRAQTRAEQTQRQMAAMVESSDDAIVTGDINGIITSWNPGAERLYGYSPPRPSACRLKCWLRQSIPTRSPESAERLCGANRFSTIPPSASERTAPGSRWMSRCHRFVTSVEK